MAYRTCDDCLYNDGYCTLGNDRIFERSYKQNQCEDGTGGIYEDDDDDDYDDDYDDD